MAKKLVERKME